MNPTEQMINILSISRENNNSIKCDIRNDTFSENNADGND